ncbi:helix-turn-helix domain-containing protein [Achromobacter sp. GG226]|uniref:transcriptional regulator n=1 Tax=Verticiella alkaliphila TaxID=2779529 RepID=UPI001C0D18E2|nr:helix-turn-helix domain-containing protein [Verticiella sp. GG226]MBU4609171.1 helix-turn-helix domain-containing protein [Verticiella sp. GG226]
MNKPIASAIDVLGSASSLARVLGVTPQAVCFWRDEKRSVPADKCLAIEIATAGAVTRRDLRPDDYWLIWPDLPAPAAAEVAQ